MRRFEGAEVIGGGYTYIVDVIHRAPRAPRGRREANNTVRVAHTHKSISYLFRGATYFANVLGRKVRALVCLGRVNLCRGFTESIPYRGPGDEFSK